MTQSITAAGGKTQVAFCCDEFSTGGVHNGTGADAFVGTSAAGVYAYDTVIAYVAGSGLTATVTLELQDVDGNLIRTVAEGVASSGRETVTLSGIAVCPENSRFKVFVTTDTDLTLQSACYLSAVWLAATTPVHDCGDSDPGTIVDIVNNGEAGNQAIWTTPYSTVGGTFDVHSVFHLVTGGTALDFLTIVSDIDGLVVSTGLTSTADDDRHDPMTLTGGDHVLTFTVNCSTAGTMSYIVDIT